MGATVALRWCLVRDSKIIGLLVHYWLAAIIIGLNQKAGDRFISKVPVTGIRPSEYLLGNFGLCVAFC